MTRLAESSACLLLRLDGGALGWDGTAHLPACLPACLPAVATGQRCA